MSNHSKHRLSLRGGQNAPITAPTEQHQAETKRPMQESKMEANPNQADQSPEISLEPNAKELAAMEERVSADAIARMKSNEASAEKGVQAESTNILGLAAQGREKLLAQMRQHTEANKPKEYVPPPMTERQLSQRELEFAAGRKSQERAVAQEAGRPQPKQDVSEGFTTPVHRPGDFVPGINSKDPAITR